MLGMDAQHTKHVTYMLAYHFVWCPTYRKRIFTVPMTAESQEEREERNIRVVILPEVVSPTGIAL